MTTIVALFLVIIVNYILGWASSRDLVTILPTLRIVISFLLITGFCLGITYYLNSYNPCVLGVSSSKCIDMCYQSKINDKGVLLNTCRIICKENVDCKVSCLDGISIEVEI